MTLNVYFVDKDKLDCTACLIENIINGNVQLKLSTSLYLDEIKPFIEKAREILLLRYENVNININWDK